MTIKEARKLKVGTILVPNGKYKSSIYFNIEKLVKVKITSNSYSYGDFRGKVIEGSIKRKDHMANGNNNDALLNIKAFKVFKPTNQGSYIIY